MIQKTEGEGQFGKKRKQRGREKDVKEHAKGAMSGTKNASRENHNNPLVIRKRDILQTKKKGIRFEASGN